MYDIYTVDQIVEKVPAVTNGGLRWMIFNREANGLAESGALLKVGKRRYIDLPKFLDWLRSQKS